MADRVAHQFADDQADIVRAGRQAPPPECLPDEHPCLPQAVGIGAHSARGEPGRPDTEVEGQLLVRIRTCTRRFGRRGCRSVT
ncbi:hypothetical protein [Streptomyces sp. NPDC057287]|uniref:hypothetical protein n=1 Tax=Streptomyces sp. NPDC057287 TaxID=3346086 RepID=UPI00363662E5